MMIKSKTNLYLLLFVTLTTMTYPTLQKCGKHKQSRFYIQKYKTKFGVD